MTAINNFPPIYGEFDPIKFWAENNKEQAESMVGEYVAVTTDGRKLIAHAKDSREVFAKSLRYAGGILIGRLSLQIYNSLRG